MPRKYDDLPTVDIPGVEIFAEGSWNGDKYTGDDLQEMVSAFGKVGFEPTVKAGHADGQESLDEKEYRKIFGAPALGYVSRIYKRGKQLVADLKQVPRNFANLIKAGTYRRVSAEIYWNYKDEANGKTYPRVLKSIAFLGAEIPALTNLKAIEALFQKNEMGALCAYANGREFRVYAMEKPVYQNDPNDPNDANGENDTNDGDEMTVQKKPDGTYCVSQGGKEMKTFPTADAAQAYVDEMSKKKMSSKAQAYADYPWDKCIQDQQDKGYDVETAKKICGSIKAANNANSKGEVHMTEAEIKAKFDEMKAEIAKDYESKQAKAVEEAVAKYQADHDTEKKAMADRIAELEKQNEVAVETARFTRIDKRLESLKSAGKITTVEEGRLRSIFRALPDVIVHSYADDKGAEVKEAVVETLWRMFESRNSNLLKELSDHENEPRTYNNAQAEVIRLAEDLVKQNSNVTMKQAYAKIAKDEPELWREYQKDVKGAH